MRSWGEEALQLPPKTPQDLTCSLPRRCDGGGRDRAIGLTGSSREEEDSPLRGPRRVPAAARQVPVADLGPVAARHETSASSPQPKDAARAYDAAAVGLHRRMPRRSPTSAKTRPPLLPMAATATAPLRHVSCVDMDAKADGGDDDCAAPARALRWELGRYLRRLQAPPRRPPEPTSRRQSSRPRGRPERSRPRRGGQLQRSGRRKAAAAAESRVGRAPCSIPRRAHLGPGAAGKLFLGAFDAAEEADGAFDAEAVKLRGAMAKTNLKRQPTVRKKAATGRTPGPSSRRAPEAQRQVRGAEQTRRGILSASVLRHRRGRRQAAIRCRGRQAAWCQEAAPTSTTHPWLPPLTMASRPWTSTTSGDAWREAKTSLNKPPLVAGSADDGESYGPRPQQLPGCRRSASSQAGSITADAQLDDMFADLPPLDLQQVGELLRTWTSPT
ncbi:hypothetical protein ZWY2020_050937 [Hordeum vulgare]|nr:hypothetical protein ZWY2020_050937 [Hordeum vulgare]